MTSGGKLTHIDEEGAARMVDVSAKAETRREAVAEGRILIAPAALDAIRAGSGEQWYVWNPRAVSIVRRLAYHEAIPLLCVALDEAGPAASFNGLVVHDYSCIWWGRIQGSPRLSVLAYRQQLERVLRRYVGRKRSLRLRDAAEPMGAARRAVRAREPSPSARGSSGRKVEHS